MNPVDVLQAHQLDALLVSQPENVRYLSGFTTPKDGQVIVHPGGALLVTDGRYTVQAAEESHIPVQIVGGDGRSRQADMEALYAQYFRGRVGFEANHLSVAALRLLEDKTGAQFIPTQGVFEAYRQQKTAQEIDYLRQAAALTDRGFAHILPFIRAGVSELEVALELEFFLRKHGSQGMAFDLAVVSGPRTAMPHGGPSERIIQTGDLVTLDFGAKVGGYCADLTRTVGVGEVAAELRAIFDAVLEAQQLSLAAIAPGQSGHHLDSLARNRLTELGYGAYFSHSLGHGVGLFIHEGPSLRQGAQELLQPTQVVTVEPGIYIPGLGGVRIEDLVLVTETGHQVLSQAPKHWQAL